MAADRGQQNAFNQQRQLHAQQQQLSLNGINGGGNANGYPQYTNTSAQNGVSNDDFHTFFNVPAEDAMVTTTTSQKASVGWNPSNAVNPRLQQQPQNATFGNDQGVNEWSQPGIHAAFRQQSSNQYGGQNVTNASNAAFIDPTQSYGMGAYYQQQQQQQQQNMAYNTSNAYVPQHYYSTNYPGTMQAAAGQSAVQGQTISPSALQEFPGTVDRNGYQNQQKFPVYGNSAAGNAIPSLRSYDDAIANQFVNALPNGRKTARGLVRDTQGVISATNSRSIGPFLLLGNEVFESDPVSGAAGKIEIRESLNGMKRKAQEQQGVNPWNDKQEPMLKRMKFHHRTLKPVVMASGPDAQVELSSGEGSSSEEDSEYESDDEVDEPSPLPSVRPSDPLKAVNYDVIKVVWFKKSKHLGGNTIREALGQYWNLVKPTRDNWKSEIAAMGEAVAKKDHATADKHKASATRYRTLLDAAFQATVKHGHSDVVGKLSENSNLFLSFYQILVDRFREMDYNGETIKSILGLMVLCTSTTAALLEKTKLDKILPRLAKKGDDTIRDMLDKIDATVKANAGGGSSKVPDSVKSEDTKSMPIKSEKGTISKGVPTSLNKSSSSIRPTVGAASKSSVSARVAVPPVKSVNGTTKPTSLKGDSKPNDIKNSNTAEAIKLKPLPGKTPSLFASLQSAGKRSGTSNSSTKPVPAVDSKIVKAEVKKPVAAPTPAAKSFSFADAIASINQTKESPTKKKEETDRPRETEEEKNKRERKEKRRSLRVRWKPDALLVQTKIFTHHPDEEIGHNSNMLQDAADVKNEGQMLKLHREMKIDEEDDLPEEAELAPWHPQSLIDMSDLPEEAKNENYQLFGGTKEITSPEKLTQEQRERSTLLAIYTSVSDIPPCPKEPYDPYSGSKQEEIEFGWGDTPHLVDIRRREAAYFARQRPAPTPAAVPDIQSILSILQQGQNQQGYVPPPPPNFQPFQGFVQAAPPPPPPPPPTSTHGPQPGSLEYIMAQFAQQKQPQPPQVPLPPPPPPPPPVPGAPIDPAILQALNTFKSMQQTPVAQPAYQAPPPPPPPTAAASNPLNLSAILAQISAATQGQSPTPIPNGENDNKRRYDGDQFGDNKRSRGDHRNISR